MRRKVIVVGCFLMLVSACSSVGNNERAYLAQHGGSYFVELKGTRRAMAHDPISAIRGHTYETTLTLELPRVEGVIDGSEIPVAEGKLPYGGSVVIKKDKMTVNLYYDDRSENTKRPLDWNGEYTLVQK